MAGSKSNYLEYTWLNFALRGGTFASPTTVYLALYTSTPTSADSDTFTEVATAGGTSYARQVVTFGAPANSSASNSASATFPIAGASYGTVNGWGIVDSATWGGGNILYFGTLNTPRTCASGEQISFLSGQIVIGES